MKYIHPKRMAAIRIKPMKVLLLLFIMDWILQNRAQKYEKKVSRGHFFRFTLIRLTATRQVPP